MDCVRAGKGAVCTSRTRKSPPFIPTAYTGGPHFCTDHPQLLHSELWARRPITRDSAAVTDCLALCRGRPPPASPGALQRRLAVRDAHTCVRSGGEPAFRRWGKPPRSQRFSTTGRRNAPTRTSVPIGHRRSPPRPGTSRHRPSGSSEHLASARAPVTSPGRSRPSGGRLGQARHLGRQAPLQLHPGPGPA